MRGTRVLTWLAGFTSAAMFAMGASAWAQERSTPTQEHVTAADLAQDQALLAFQRDLVSVLALRAEAQPLLAAALLARPLAGQPAPLSFHELIERATAAPGAGAAVTWARLADCSQVPSQCPNPDARKALVKEAPDNAAVWLLKLGLDVRAQDHGAAREDLAKAAVAKVYDDYVGTSLEALAKTVGTLPPPAATLNPAYASGAMATQVMLVFGLGHTLPQPALQVAAKLCTTPDADAHTKADCLKLGKTLEWGSSPLARSLGLHLRETLAADRERQHDAAQERINLAWQVQSFAKLNARALQERAVAQGLLALARSGGTEMSLMLAALRENQISAEAPAGWSPSPKP
jgi:hypothetical protein